MQSSKAGTWLCGGITGAITNLIKHMIYSGTIMVQMSPTDYARLQFYNLTDDLVDPAAGVVEGNAIRYTVQLTNTIELADIPLSALSSPGAISSVKTICARPTSATGGRQKKRTLPVSSPWAA